MNFVWWFYKGDVCILYSLVYFMGKWIFWSYYWKISSCYECGSLGQNNPLGLLDCSIFKLDKGMCCLLTITKTKKSKEEDVVLTEEYYETACIILERIDAQVINATSREYNYLIGDVLIKLSPLYLNVFI